MIKTALIALLLTSSLYAVQAFPGEITFKQADGTTFIGHLKGDEHFNWAELKNGSVLLFNKESRNYEYAKRAFNSEGEVILVPSGKKAVEGEASPFVFDKKLMGEIAKRNRIKRFGKVPAHLHHNHSH